MEVYGDSVFGSKLKIPEFISVRFCIFMVGTHTAEGDVSLCPDNYNTSAASITQPSKHPSAKQPPTSGHRRSEFDSVR